MLAAQSVVDASSRVQGPQYASREEYFDSLDPRELKKARRKEEKRRKKLEKALKEKEKLAQAKNTNNYLATKIAFLQKLDIELDSGMYVNTPFAFLKENPLILDLYKNKEKLQSAPFIQMMSNGKEYTVYNPRVKEATQNVTKQICFPANIGEKFIVENTHMKPEQARGMINTLGTV